MKRLLTLGLLISALFGFSQGYQSTKEGLLKSIYGNINTSKKVINHDKSFVSDDRLFYESVDATQVYKSHQVSDKELIEKTLKDYMNGSSYNKLDILENAFTKNATLYLTNRDGLFKLYTPKEYTGFFKNAEYGTFNGRDAKILEIEQIKDIATAKVEIAGPEREWIYIDLFLLKKLEDGWKIISKTATRVDEPKRNSVLFILSNAHFYGKTNLNTGNSFSEIVNAYDVFINAGYSVDFVSPKGGAVPLAYINTSDDMSKKYLYDTNFMNALKNTKSPSEINASKYKAVQYIGGGGAIYFFRLSWHSRYCQFKNERRKIFG